MWRESDDPVSEIKHEYSGCGVEDIFVYPNLVKKKLHEFFYSDIRQTKLWAFALQQLSAGCRYPVVVFKMSRHARYWVLTNKSLTDIQAFQPRIKIPVKGSASDMSIMTLEAFLEETIDE
jgi:hypothetical protein